MCGYPSFLPDGVYAITFIPKAFAISATLEPILPNPIIARVLPKSSQPKNFARSNLPSFTLAQACGIFLDNANIIPIVCSAVASVFPLGEFKSKDEIRKIARIYNLKVANKPDSEDICFIPDGNYKKFLEENSNIKPKKGNIVNSKGEVLKEKMDK